MGITSAFPTYKSQLQPQLQLKFSCRTDPRCAKHMIQTIVEKAQTLHFTACLPASWWEFTTNHAVHLINHTPTKWLDWKTPLEIRTGVIPNFTEYKVFGCAAYVYLPEEV